MQRLAQLLTLSEQKDPVPLNVLGVEGHKLPDRHQPALGVYTLAVERRVGKCPEKSWSSDASGQLRYIFDAAGVDGGDL